jgi:hypothetical protein
MFSMYEERTDRPKISSFEDMKKYLLPLVRSERPKEPSPVPDSKTSPVHDAPSDSHPVEKTKETEKDVEKTTSVEKGVEKVKEEEGQKEEEKECQICWGGRPNVRIANRLCGVSVRKCGGHMCGCSGSLYCFDCLMMLLWEQTPQPLKEEGIFRAKCPFCQAEFCSLDLVRSLSASDLLPSSGSSSSSSSSSSKSRSSRKKKKRN